MATYLVGDIQGCFDELQALLEQVNFDENQDRLYLVGDLIARGPKSLETLRWVKSMSHCAYTVLGNHDLHLLATYLGIHEPKKADKIRQVLKAPDVHELMDWLRQQPLLIEEDEFVVCHAGISPQWDLATARQAAQYVESKLRSDQWKKIIKSMYKNQPDHWDESLEGKDRYRYIINAYTRMRFCTQDGGLEFSCKNHPREVAKSAQGKGLMPWYQVTNRIALGKTVVFGHWAALMGCFDNDAKVIGLDTGCVWGNYLTLLRWEDKAVFKQGQSIPEDGYSPLEEIATQHASRSLLHKLQVHKLLNWFRG